MGDDVGYGRPPRRTRFKRGQSGNPKGRPRRSRNVDVLLKEILVRNVTVTDKGRGGQRKISYLEAILQQTVNKAVHGDPKALNLVLRMVSPLSSVMARADAATEDVAERVRRIRAELAERFGVAPSFDEGSPEARHPPAVPEQNAMEGDQPENDPPSTVPQHEDTETEPVPRGRSNWLTRAPKKAKRKGIT